MEIAEYGRDIRIVCVCIAHIVLGGTLELLLRQKRIPVLQRLIRLSRKRQIYPRRQHHKRVWKLYPIRFRP